MTSVIRIIEPATPENIREGDYITLHRVAVPGAGVQVRGTVHRWDPVFADWLTIKGWPNQRFHIDGNGAGWTVTRIQREEELPDQGVPFIAGYASIDGEPSGQIRVPGVLLHGVFYVVHSSAGTYRPAHWTDFRTTD